MDPSIIAAIIIAALLLAGPVFLVLYLQMRKKYKAEAAQRTREGREHQAFRKRYGAILDVEAERERLLAQQKDLEASVSREQGILTTLRAESQKLQREIAELDEEANMYSFGLYKPRYQFESSKRYKQELDAIRKKQKQMVKNEQAAVCETQWHVDGNVRKGRSLTKRYHKLMLRAFNGECDSAIAKVKYNNVQVMEKRMHRAFEAINRMGSKRGSRITPRYLDLKLDELHLNHEYHEKRQAEIEEQREIRKQMQEEMRAQKEMEKAIRDAEKEEQRYQKALAKAREEVERAVGTKQEKLRAQIEELQQRLEEAHANSERAMSRAQMTRSGHVYVISNIGSFGEDVYKIGMTRRLEPMDRVRELGDASVPFRFDVHAIIYAEDAPALENELHKRFDDRRLNRVNTRKEFFRVTMEELEEAVADLCGEIELTKVAEAEEYRKTLAIMNGEVHTNGQTEEYVFNEEED